MRKTVGGEGLGQAFGYIGMGMILGGIAGPLLGGALYEHAGYYAVFGLAFAFLGLDMLFRIILIEAKPAMNGLECRGESPEGSLPAHSAPDEEANPRSLPVGKGVRRVHCRHPQTPKRSRLCCLVPASG